MKVKRIDVLFVCILTVLAGISIIFHFYPENAILFKNFTSDQLTSSLLVAIGMTFLISLIGNLLPFPTPYVLVLWLVAQNLRLTSIFFPLLPAFVASIACLLGELISYYIGKSARGLLDSEKQSKLEFYRSIFTHHPSWAPLLIWGFGATPLSDDILLVPLGLLNYDAKKTFFYCWLGKFTFMLVIAYLPDFFGWLEPGYNFISTMMPLFIVTILLWLLIRIDWETWIINSPKIRKFLKV